MDALATLHRQSSAESGPFSGLQTQDRAKLRALHSDFARLEKGQKWFAATAFSKVFSVFERAFPGKDRSAHRRKFYGSPDSALSPQPVLFAGEFDLFDRLSIIYGGLFRGSVVVNYTLGVVAFALTLGSMLTMPLFMTALIPDAFRFFLQASGAVLEVICIFLIGVIFSIGYTPSHGNTKNWRILSRGLERRVARRWHERWLEYRLLAERFRYLELMLPLAPNTALHSRFVPPANSERHWYDLYFVWRTEVASPVQFTARAYRARALALIRDQIEHHELNSFRRGTIARDLHRTAILLFFMSLLLCLLDVTFELFTLACDARIVAGRACAIAPCFHANWRSLVLFGAGIAPALSAAIHGVLSTTEYTKLAETSVETADRIYALFKKLVTIDVADAQATPETLAPIRDIVEQFAEEVFNEATGWKAMLRDKNVPLT